MNSIGRMLMIVGAVMLGAGLLITYFNRLPFNLGKLPGDIMIKGKSSTFYFPLTTCILLSLVFSILSWLLRRR